MSEPEYPHSEPFRARVVAQPTGASDIDEAAAARAANRFDIRRIIGGLFCLYAVILIVTRPHRRPHGQDQGRRDQHRPVDRRRRCSRSAIFMLAWGFLRPVRPEPPETRGEGSGRLRRAPAT